MASARSDFLASGAALCFFVPLPWVSALSDGGDAKGRRSPNTPAKVGRSLPRGGRVDQAAYGRDAIGRKADAPGVFFDGRLVRGEVDAIHFVAGYVAMEPLDLGTHFPQNLDRLLRHFSQLGFG